MMFGNHKKDPLVDSMKAIMNKTNIERQAAEKVNEVWGIQSRKQLPHEQYAKYDQDVQNAQKIALSEGVEAVTEVTLSLKEETLDETPKLKGKAKQFDKVFWSSNKDRIKDADKEADKKPVVKESTTLNEISKKVIGSYIKKAKESMGNANFQHGKLYGKELATKKKSKDEREEGKKLANTYRKRMNGIDMAADKLTKEDTLNEISKKVLASYVKKASSSAANIGRSIGYDRGVVQGRGGSDNVLDNKSRKHRAEKDNDKGHKRIAGIEKAADRLSGEYKPKSMKYNANEDTQPATMLTVIQEEIRQYLMKEIDAMSESRRDDYIASLNEEQRAILFMNEEDTGPAPKKDTSTSTATNAPPPPLVSNAGSVSPSTPVSVAPPSASTPMPYPLNNRAPMTPATAAAPTPVTPRAPQSQVPNPAAAAFAARRPDTVGTRPLAPAPAPAVSATAATAPATAPRLPYPLNNRTAAPMAPKAPVSMTAAPMSPMPPGATVKPLTPTVPAKQIPTAASTATAKPTVAKPASTSAAARKPMQPNRTPRTGSPAQSSQGPLRSGIPGWAAKAFNPDGGG